MKICIVGNGSGVLKKENGTFIDSCDLVVRIKNFKIKGFEKNVGEKIDIFSSKWFSWFDKNTNKPLKFDFINDVKTLFFMFPNQEDINIKNNKLDDYTSLYVKMQLENELPNMYKDWNHHIHLLNDFSLINKDIVYFDIEDIQDLCINILKLNTMDYYFYYKGEYRLLEPTCGIRTIYKILKMYPNEEIFLTGFDGFQTNWYWDNNHVINKKSHHYLSEIKYLNFLKKNENIVFLDY